MGCCVSSWILFLHLVVLLLAHDTEAIETSHDHPPSDLRSTYFFKLKDMKLGTKMALYLEKKPTSSARLLPREQADSIPFSSQHLPYLLKLFSFSQGSRQALAVEHTLRKCETPPSKGETRRCVTSMESMHDFVHNVFETSGSDSDDHPTLLRSALISNDEKSVYQNYTALKSPEEVLSSKMIVCVTMIYPYMVFYCEAEESGDKLYKIPFVADNGDKLEALAICYEETWDWDADHVSFVKLGTTPGNPVCHIFPPNGNYIWVDHTPPTTSI